ncbi:MAG: PP2C family protein-serine/threonine phosphatase [Sporichthyaceae bacterium]
MAAASLSQPEIEISPAIARALARVVRLAQRIVEVPMALFSVVEDREVTFYATAGLPEGLTGLPLEQSFCRIAVGSREPLVVPDALLDPRFRDLDVVRGAPGVRFYAAVPLGGTAHRAAATLSVIDVRPRELTARQIQALRDLASWVEDELDRDLDLREARDIQRSLLPTRSPENPGLEFAGRCLPARDIGGDFFDHFERDGATQILLADVTGRGLPAVILAATVRASLRAAYRDRDGLAAMVNRSADSLHADLERTGGYATLFAARLEPDGRVEYVAAGHALAWVVHRDGSALTRLTCAELPLGLVAHSTLTARRLALKPGETLVAVSDGTLHLFPDRAVAERELLSLFAPPACLEGAVESLAAPAADRAVADDVAVIAIRRRL